MSIIERLIRVLYASLYHHVGGNGRYNKKRQRTFEDESFDDRFWHAQEPQRDNQIDPVLARYYANLEIPYGSDIETVKQAWKRLLKKYHPDLHSSDPEKQRTANELVQGLNRAYEELIKRLTK